MKHVSNDVQPPKRREHVFLKESLLKEFIELLETPEKKEEFKNLLDGRDLKRLREIHDLRKNKEDSSDNIPEFRSFLSRSCLQKVLAIMLEDVAKYAEYLKLFISHFKAYNECIEPQYVTKPEKKKDLTMKEKEIEKLNSFVKLHELDSPLHCAARQLDVPFLDWLLKQPVAEPTVAEGTVTAMTVTERAVSERTEDDQPAAELTVAGPTIAETIVAEPTDAERPKAETAVAEQTVVEQTSLNRIAVEVNRIAVEVNLRNKAKETALALLCIRYDYDKQRLKQPFYDRNEQTKINEGLATVKVMIEKLLAKGADFNIFTGAALPFDLLRKYSETGDEEARAFVNGIITTYTGAIACSGFPRHSVRFYGETTNNISVTIELLEIFVRFNDIDHFRKYWNEFVVTDCNVKNVITLLLHPAVEQARVNFANDIIKKHKDLIFKYDEANKMDHRVELKGLLKKPCVNGDPNLLKYIFNNTCDRLLLTEVPLLIITVNKAHRAKNDKEADFKDCAKFLIDNYMKVPIHATDSDGNTALHLALKFGFEKLALLMLEKQHGLMGLRNRQNLTPVEYGTLQFWESYLDSCIKPKRPVIRINVSFLRPIEKENRTMATPPTKVTSPTEATTQTEATPQEGRAQKIVRGSRRRTWRWPDSWKILQPVKERYNSKCLFAQTVTEMTTLRLIAQSKERKRLLLHPTLMSFIMMKWMRLCHWNILNLLLTTLTMLSFGAYTLMPYSNDGYTAWSLLSLILSVMGAFFMALRELTQVWLLRWSYVTFENVVDTLTVILMIFVLSSQSGAYAPIYSSFVVVSLALQLSFLLGSLSFNNLATILYMFKTVSKNFFESFLLFTPLVGSFVYGFYLTNNVTPIDYCTADNCSQENFNNFRSFWNATIKTLVMTTGEFEAANVDFEGGKVLLFIGFLFLAPIVILNLINGLAVSDIAAIREESKVISICKKVKQLERYERGIVKVLAFRAGSQQLPTGSSSSALANNTTKDEQNPSQQLATGSSSSPPATNATPDEKNQSQKRPTGSSSSAPATNATPDEKNQSHQLATGSSSSAPATNATPDEKNQSQQRPTGSSSSAPANNTTKDEQNPSQLPTGPSTSASTNNSWGWKRFLFRKPLFPGSFFEEHEPALFIVTNELNKLGVTDPRCDRKDSKTSSKATDRGSNTKEREPAPTEGTNEFNKLGVTDPRCDGKNSETSTTATDRGTNTEEHEPAPTEGTNEFNKVGVTDPRCDGKNSETSTAATDRGTNTEEHEPAPTEGTNEFNKVGVTDPRCYGKDSETSITATDRGTNTEEHEPAPTEGTNKSNERRDNQNSETSTKAIDPNVTPKQEDSNSNTTEKDRTTQTKKNNIKPIPIFPGLPESWLEQSFKFRSYQIPLFVTLDTSYVNEAMTIGEKRDLGGSDVESRDPADTKQPVTSTGKNSASIKRQKPIKPSETTTPAGPVDETQTAAYSVKKKTSNRRQRSPEPTTDPRDKQIKLLQEQLNNMMKIMCGIRQEIRTKRNCVCEDQQRVEDQAIADNTVAGQPVDQ